MPWNQSQSPKKGSDTVASHLYFGDSAYFHIIIIEFRKCLIIYKTVKGEGNEH